MIVEHTTWAGRSLKATWVPEPFYPPRNLSTQSSGICFTPGSEIVLVRTGTGPWGLPGGHPESHETLEEALVREVLEEACASVEQYKYIGCMKVEDPDHPDGLTLSYSARFWAKVKLLPFHPEFETTERTQVKRSQFLATLSWGTTRIAEAILVAGLLVERRLSS